MSTAPFLIGARGASLAFSATASGVPVVTHWGARPDGDADEVARALAATSAPAVTHSSFDSPRVISALPAQREGWSGAPALELHRGRRALPLRLVVVAARHDGSTADFDLVDEVAGVAVRLHYAFDDNGVLRASIEVRNTGGDALEVQAVRLLLPLPVRAAEILDLTGRWTGERRAQRGPLLDGAHVRAGRRGRTGHDAPLVEMVGTSGFAFRRGEVWGAHVGWSGDAEHRVERLSEGVGVLASMLGGGELLEPGEVVLDPGAAYRSPDVFFVWSDTGIDGLSARLHPAVRAFPAYPRAPRPVTLNTWEAVYMDQSFQKLEQLAEAAQRIGVERFVLDDGWFQARRDDTIGLGDWTVDATVWPEGLEPIAERVRALGMQFGLWFEPEMVNLGSSVAKEHPDWVLGPDELGPSWRHQYLLNVADPDAYAHLLGQIDELVGRLGIAFIKWDHNRDLHEPIDRRTGVAAVHEQTLAVYRLMDELRSRHPGLEIESCASGGARVDLGVMQHAQRVWASDTNDAIERTRIQEWTEVLLPPELVGSHVGPERSHTTARAIDLPFRLLTSLLAHAGIEWDITECTPEETRLLTRWTALVKSLRPLVATGVVVHADDLPAGSALHGVVAPDGSHGVFVWSQVAVGPLATTPRVPVPGLDVDRSYRIELSDELGPAARRSLVDPAWVVDGALVLPGSVLADPGVPLPALHPGQALLLRVEPA